MINYIIDLCKALSLTYQNFKIHFKNIRDIRNMSKSMPKDYVIAAADYFEMKAIGEIKAKAESSYDPEKSQELIREYKKNNEYEAYSGNKDTKE